MVDAEELQRLAQLVEVNRERLQTIEQQIRNLENISLEQSRAMEALEAISEEGATGVMVPLGAGVQLIADIPAEAGAVVDMGSRVQAEKTREEPPQIVLSKLATYSSLLLLPSNHLPTLRERLHQR